MKKILILVAISCFGFSTLQAQQTDEPAVIRQFKELFLKKDFTAVYDLYAGSFKQQFPKDASDGLLAAVHNGVGDNITFKQTSQEGSHYIFILTGTRSAAQADLYLSTDQKISGLRLSPAKKQEASGINVSAAIGNSNPMTTVNDKKVDSVIRAAFKPGIVGMAVAVIKAGKVSYYGYGDTKKGANSIPTEADIYEIGSISKTFTATILANLVKESKINLDKDFRYYLPKLFPGFKGAANSITVKQLANHTAGIPSMPANFSAPNAKQNEDIFNYYTQANLEDYIKTSLPAKAGDGKFAYSNMGFAILGYTLEQVAHTNYDELVNKYVVKPLGLKNTYVKNRPGSKITSGYRDGMEMAPLNLQALAPAGMVKSNLADMVTYTRANMKKQGAIGLAQTETYADEKIKLGLSWIMLTGKDGKVITFHNGATAGYSSFLGFTNDTQTAVIVLSNTLGDVTGAGVNLLRKLN